MSASLRSRVVLALEVLAAAIAVAGLLQRSALAQGSAWTEPVLVFESPDLIHAPALVADDYGQVHGFWEVQPTDVSQPFLIYYSRLDKPELEPVDILISDGRGLRATRGAGGLALLWRGSTYSLAGPSPAMAAKDWGSPVSLAASFDSGGLATAPDDALWIVYGSKETPGVFVQRFDPVRLDWDNPLFAANTSNVNAAPDSLRLAVGNDGSLHAVWSEYQLPDGWPPIGVYYAQSVDGGQTWSLPRSIAGDLKGELSVVGPDGQPPQFNQPNVATGPDGQVYVAWLGVAGTGGKYFQESPDGGRTWNSPIALVPSGGGGSEGAPNLAVDGAGGVHIVYSYNGCVWHVSLDRATWSAPECVSNNSSAHIEEPVMTIGLGNQLHVLYWTDNHQLWYTTRTLAIPGKQPLPLPTLPPPTATPVVPTLTPVPTATRPPDFGPLPPTGLATESGFWALAAGAAPVVILLAFALAQRRR